MASSPVVWRCTRPASDANDRYVLKKRKKNIYKGEEAPKIDDEKELDKYVSGLKYEEELYEKSSLGFRRGPRG
jgi:hypothetical protein